MMRHNVSFVSYNAGARARSQVGFAVKQDKEIQAQAGTYKTYIVSKVAGLEHHHPEDLLKERATNTLELLGESRRRATTD